MSNGRGFSQPGQRESIIRGERTDPRAVLRTCVAFAGAATFFVLLVMFLVMVNANTSWRWIGDNWRWLIIFPAVGWIIGALLALIVLFYEAIDPNWPPPRDATTTTRILFPWSKERGTASDIQEEEWEEDYDL